jgi:phosphatidyl-myo-inositol dimannoside synthase
MTGSPPHLTLGAISLDAHAGGIARLSRLVARVLVDEQQAGRLRLHVLSFFTPTNLAQLPCPVGTVGGSKVRFGLAALWAAARSHFFCYDACNLAQVHQLPLIGRRPFFAFLCGIELWEQTRPGYLRAARQAELLLAISNFTLQKAAALHGEFPRARVCWLGTETDELPELGRAVISRQPQVLIVGRLDATQRYKGHRELIACWHQVVAAVPDARLHIVGEGSDRPALEQHAAESSARERITFHGLVPESDLERFYAEATVFCMPSRGEGFGLVYVEAMRHGLPVVASVHDAGSEVVVDGETGYTVNLDRPEELPERLIHLLKNPDHAAAMGRQGQRRWTEHFSYSAFRDRLRPILHEFLTT